MNEAASVPIRKSGLGSAIVFGLAFVVIAGLIALLAFGLRERDAPPLASGRAPDFALTTFNGQQVTLSQLRGKAVVVNFWASWCIPCRDEAPVLESAWENYRDRGLVVVGVDYVDTDPEALKFLSDFHQTYPNGADLGTRISQEYRITGVPETYFVGKDGKLLAGIDASGHAYGNWIGPLTADALTARVQLLLAQ